MANPGSIQDLFRKLIDACRQGDTHSVQQLVDILGDRVHQTKALEKAAQKNHLACVNIILSVTPRANKNIPALLHALNHRNLQMAEALVPYCNINQFKILKTVCHAGYKSILSQINLSMFNLRELYDCFRTAAHEGHFHCLDLFEGHVLAQDKRDVMQEIVMHTTNPDMFESARPYVDLQATYWYCVQNEIDAPLIKEYLNAEKDKEALTKAIKGVEKTAPKRKM